MSRGIRQLLVVNFERFVKAHRRCGAFAWDTGDTEDGVGVEVKARCLGCDARFQQSATAGEMVSALVHSRLVTSVN